MFCFLVFLKSLTTQVSSVGSPSREFPPAVQQKCLGIHLCKVTPGDVALAVRDLEFMNCSIVYIFLTVYTWLYVSVFIHLLILSLIYTSIPSMSVSVSLEHCCVVYTILGTEGTVQSTCSEEVSGIVTVNYIIELPTQKENELREYIAHRLILKE